jgi:hypothetical protein
MYRGLIMPYIKEENRISLDDCIDHMVICLKNSAFRTSFDPDKTNYLKKELNNEDFLAIVGDINYCFSRIITGTMGDVSYPKIAVITGVLENIKQEFYRRAATPFEDLKIKQNGDIKEYKKY